MVLLPLAVNSLWGKKRISSLYVMGRLQISNDKLSFHSIKLECSLSDLSLEMSNMKLKIHGCIEYSQINKGIGLWSI